MHMVFENPTIREILDRYKQIWALRHASALMDWDVQTYMPPQGIEHRSIAIAQLSLLSQKFITDPSFIALVEKAEGAELNDYERGVVRVLKREIKYNTKIPPKLLEEITVTTQEATVAWREAREKSNFSLFRPRLEKIIELSRQVAEKLGYEKHPYNALLDLYEEGFTVADADAIFSKLVPSLRSIINRQKMPPHSPLEDVKYERGPAEAMINDILRTMGYDFNRFRVDVSPHPFTIGLGPRDVRITVRYEGIDFKRVLFSAIHEGGHALYELQLDESLAMTPIFDGASMGIHESQSRFWENIVGRSKPFVEAMYPIMKKHLGFLNAYSPSDLYIYFNTVKPSLIRVDADEVTYNMHIAVRYELEKLMLTGEIKVSDLPELWNRKMEEYLGIHPSNDAEGVLQDIHWSQGSIGYFPTYTLGNLVAAMVGHFAGKLLDEVAELKFDGLKAWLREKIHRYGATYDPKTLLKKSFGESYNPDYLINYLSRKYL